MPPTTRSVQEIESDFQPFPGKNAAGARFLALGNGRVLLALYSKVFSMGPVVMAQTFGSNVSEIMKARHGDYDVVHMSGDRSRKNLVTVKAVAATGSIDDEEGLQRLFKLIDQMNPPDDYLVIPYGVTDGVLVQGANLSPADLAHPAPGAKPGQDKGKYIRDLYRVVEKLLQTKPKLKISIINTDNKDGNGTLITDMLLKIASVRNPALATQIKARVRAHETMVDLIANPYKDDSGKMNLAVPEVEETLPKEHVVLEDSEAFIPAKVAAQLEACGFIVAREPGSVINKYHPKKLRIMNANHTAFVAAAALAGHINTGTAVQDPAVDQYLRRLYEKDFVVIGEELHIDRKSLDQAFGEWMRRINRVHSTFWIAMNFPSKAVIRFIPTIKALLARGRMPSKEMAFAIASNLRYLTPAGKSADPLKPGVYIGFLDQGVKVPHVDYERIGTNPANQQGVFMTAEGNSYEFRFPNDPVIIDKLGTLVSASRPAVDKGLREVLARIGATNAEKNNGMLVTMPALEPFVKDIVDMYDQMVRAEDRQTAMRVLQKSVLTCGGCCGGH